jgi:DNA topoisomerase-1
VLWRKLPGAKSAGRVQSVALRLIADREREIELFRAQEYWSVSATMEADGQEFLARLVRHKGEKIDRLSIGDQGSAMAAKAAVEAGRFAVVSVDTKPLTRNPPPPFTTSTLQQEAARKLGFSASHTMRVAQALYEEGSITYMRTDGVDMAPEAISGARRAIVDRYDAGYVPGQAAHLPDQGQECAGSARGDPPHRFRPRLSGLGRSRPALRPHPQARARQPDGLRADGADQRRA